MSEYAPIEMSVVEAHRVLQNDPSAWLLDVREPSEHALCSIAGATLIPMGQIPARIAEIPRDRHVLVQCHHGGRSLRVTQFLRAQGFTRVTNVGGGIDAWSVQIDPDVPRY